jgi:hypothetical protein
MALITTTASVVMAANAGQTDHTSTTVPTSSGDQLELQEKESLVQKKKMKRQLDPVEEKSGKVE